ncbi:hypothetical protein [Mammaliicoccus sciuri]|uniref:hypothetical protein n=1 Tax=Mammaliicoccus sciuri TaxID=1296 RepID=UPI00265B8AFB|nr:hypothetical protein [Mammaliicoccus sciuri]MDO0948196.1 hypothetical protein [Mammaliicoccus sciuri]MDO0953433.1 hypothetical protein [Mammaliicoccus sciuri]
MPTIKRKVEMNLGELLCWAIDNKEQARFRDISSKSMRVRFNDNAKPEIIFDKRFLPTYETFTVEIEEEITEDMKLHTVERFISRYEKKYKYETHHNKSIKDILEYRLPHVETTHIYAEIDNDLVLIWRDGKLVE